VSATPKILTVLKRIFIVIGIFIAFTLGLLGAIYLSLRSSETRVPDIVGKDRMSAENTISSAGLNFRVRATRPTSEAKPDTVLIQLPHAGEIVKVGQTVAVDISRPGAETESSTTTKTNSESTNKQVEQTNNSNSDESNTNDNKEKKKTTNRNTNDNLNVNSNVKSANRDRNLNANTATNENSDQPFFPTHPSTNSNGTNTKPNVNRGTTNSNTVRRPPEIAPTPQF